MSSAGLGLTVWPASAKIAGTSGWPRNSCKPAGRQPKPTQTRSAWLGSRKTAEPLDPWCRRFSRPLVEKTFKNWSKSPTCAVDSIIWLIPSVELVVARRTGLGEDAFFRLDDAEALDDVERPVVRLGDVHVQAQVVLARHHLRRTAGTVRDGGVVERLDHGVLVEGAGLVDGVLPELQAAVHARACAARCELRTSGEALVVPLQQFLAERVIHALVPVEAAVETFDMFCRHQVEEVLVEVGADELSTALREAGVVELLDEGG